jgi:hypothetical protein
MSGNDKYEVTASPSAGVSKLHTEKKDTAFASAGVKVHAEKGKNEPISEPSCGGTVRDSKLTKTNQEEHVSAPSAGDASSPKKFAAKGKHQESLHSAGTPVTHFGGCDD